MQQYINATTYVAKREVTFLGKTYAPGAEIDDPEIPGYVLQRAASRNNIAIATRRVLIGETPDEPQEASGKPAETKGGKDTDEAAKADEAAAGGAGDGSDIKGGDDLPVAYLNRWITAWKREKRQSGKETAFPDFVVARADKRVPKGNVREMLVALREAEVTP